MNRKRLLVNLNFWFVILNSIFTIPLAFAEKDDYLQLLQAELNKIAADYTAGGNANAGKQPNVQPLPVVVNNNHNSKKITAAIVQVPHSSNKFSDSDANPPANFTAGRVSVATAQMTNKQAQSSLQTSDSNNSSSDNELIKNNKKIVSDAAYLKSFIATSKLANLGYYYKVLNQGEGRNACNGNASFRLTESTVNKVKDQGDFTFKCKDLPPILADALSKIKKNGQIEVLTSAYQVYRKTVGDNGYQENSLIKYTIKSMD